MSALVLVALACAPAAVAEPVAELQASRASRAVGVEVAVDALPPAAPQAPRWRGIVGVAGGVALAPGLGPAPDLEARLGVEYARVQLAAEVVGAIGARDAVQFDGAALGEADLDTVRATVEAGYCHPLVSWLDACGRVGVGYEWVFAAADGGGIYQRQSATDGTPVGAAEVAVRAHVGGWLRLLLGLDVTYRGWPPSFPVEGVEDTTALPRVRLRPGLGAEFAIF